MPSVIRDTLSAIRVILADDHPALRLGLRVLLERTPDIQVVGEAGDGAEALAQIEQLRPEVAVLDCKLPGLDGVEVAAELQRRRWPTRVLALSSYAEEHYVRGMLEAGAVGYLMKDEATQRIVEAVRAAASGKKMWTAEQLVRGQTWQDEIKARWEQLTTRERQVLHLVASGRTNQRIAQELRVSEKTVEYHVTNILSKLGVASRSEAMVWLKTSGLVNDA